MNKFKTINDNLDNLKETSLLQIKQKKGESLRPHCLKPMGSLSRSRSFLPKVKVKKKSRTL